MSIDPSFNTRRRAISWFLNLGNRVDAINLLRTERNFIALSERIEYQTVLHREFRGVCAGAGADCPVASKLNGYGVFSAGASLKWTTRAPHSGSAMRPKARRKRSGDRARLRGIRKK